MRDYFCHRKGVRDFAVYSVSTDTGHRELESEHTTSGGCRAAVRRLRRKLWLSEKNPRHTGNGGRGMKRRCSKNVYRSKKTGKFVRGTRKGRKTIRRRRVRSTKHSRRHARSFLRKRSRWVPWNRLSPKQKRIASALEQKEKSKFMSLLSQRAGTVSDWDEVWVSKGVPGKRGH